MILKSRKIEKDDSAFLSLIPKNKSEDYRLLYNALKDHASIYTVSLDSFKSRRNSQEYIEECERFIADHKNDYKFEDEILEKQNEIDTTQKALEYMNRLEKRSGEDPLIGCMCVAVYSERFSIVFSANVDEEDILCWQEMLVNKIVDDAKENGSIIVEGSNHFAGCEKIELLGEFTLAL